ncbi:uncharacterized protein MONOS_7083 [Monocercomonoides exilis]|uniref:uncharacterized protein n=1 Tax=Monocercomonoides exilis TaxID=2049356 RepID=UPI00355A37C2|nr:hypothetical protein MONOS_7083 [Monocercomonoides exilis]|eukprot:MONOS_7083.1-p1 / transcript=MONOS_7083.1 / gene=MONOS_7083 / organism=Monocercomonoides_exilis_PA203 / gene_product=unspecified product / transcript_product=unspecified product / location=Mono_scaffold00235:15274-16054(+) / protein_length=177 / sequence_SO=supercontig / SO=protein_coding / is_pseudo=false
MSIGVIEMDDTKQRIRNILEKEKELRKESQQNGYSDGSNIHKSVVNPKPISVADRIYAVFICFVAFLLFKYTNYLDVVMHDERINRFWMKAAEFSLSVFLCCAFYIMFKSHDARKLPLNQYSARHPKMIPFASCWMVATIILYIIAHWNAYSFFSILIVFGWCYLIIHAAYLLPDW